MPSESRLGPGRAARPPRRRRDTVTGGGGSTAGTAAARRSGTRAIDDIRVIAYPSPNYQSY